MINRYVATIVFTLLLVLGAVFTPAPAIAAMDHSTEDLLTPALSGGNGTFRLLSAQRPYGDDLSMQFGFHLQYFSIEDFFAFGDDTTRFIGQFSTSIVPCEYFELFGSWYASSSNDNTNATLIQQFGNFNVGIKSGFDLSRNFSTAVAIQTEYLNNSPDLNLTGKAWNFIGSLLLTWDMTRSENPWPIRLHGNVGYKLDNSIDLTDGTALTAKQRYFLRVYPENQLVWGLGMEVPADFVNFIAEYSTEQIITSGNGDYFDHPQRVTLGAKIFPTEGRNVSIDIGSDIGVFNDAPASMSFAEPDYNLIAGFSYAWLPGRAVAKVAPSATGGVAGIVLDAATLKPLGGAIITFPEIELTRLQSHPTNGTFGFSGITPGNITAHIELADYQSADAQIVVKANETATPEIRLNAIKEAKKGLLILKLSNADNRAISGQMAFAEHPTMAPLAIPATGLRAKLSADTYKILVSSDGYLPEEHEITIEPDGKLLTEFSLREKNSKVQLVKDKIIISDKIPFATGKWALLPGSHGILNRVADLINDTPTVAKVRVEGHTDSTGNEAHNIFISQKRAESVVDYLVSRKVDRSRLEAVGYGPSRPLQDNNTTIGRNANRRVEFTVLEKEEPKVEAPAAPVTKPTPAPAPETPAAPAPAPETPAAPTPAP